MPRQRKYQPTPEECRTAYWNACASYEARRTDPYSTWSQINDAATDVAIARTAWINAAKRQIRARDTSIDVRAAAATLVCQETGEDVGWVLNRARRG